MCFCAPASLAAASGLAIVGGVSLANAKKSQLMLASIPVLFAIQQLIEAMQWMAPHPSLQSITLGYAFLLFAFILWPSYIPLTVYLIEKDQKRKRIITWFLGFGIVMSWTLLLALFVQPLIINLLAKGIDYHINFPSAWFNPLTVIYLAATCGSLLLSTKRFINYIGVATLASAIFTLVIFRETFTSVWCFFAAVISGLIYFYIRSENKQRPSKKAS